jgi:hypothetical protein
MRVLSSGCFVVLLGRWGRLFAINWKAGGYHRLFVGLLGRLFATNWKVGGYHRLFVGLLGRLFATNWKVGGYICDTLEHFKKDGGTHNACV